VTLLLVLVPTVLGKKILDFLYFQAAFDDAIAELDTLSEESYKAGGTLLHAAKSSLCLETGQLSLKWHNRYPLLPLCTVPYLLNNLLGSSM